MKDGFLFSPKKIVNPDDSAIAYSEGKLLVTNRYTYVVGYEHDLENNPVGIREHENFIELGSLFSDQAMEAFSFPARSWTSCRVAQIAEKNYALIIQQHHTEIVFPLSTPVLIVQSRRILTVGTRLSPDR